MCVCVCVSVCVCVGVCVCVREGDFQQHSSDITWAQTEVLAQHKLNSSSWIFMQIFTVNHSNANTN